MELQNLTELTAVRAAPVPAGLPRADLNAYVEALYGKITPDPCPFTSSEIDELQTTGEMLVYLPSGLTASDLLKLWAIRANIDLAHEKMIRTCMLNESQWFIASAKASPELLDVSGQAARRIYEEEGLHGMDLRRYLAFTAAYRYYNGRIPDERYWCFLLSGSYDRSGVSIVGFDVNGVLSHHGWMRNFRAKFAGSRYAILAPRIELTPSTSMLTRAYRGCREAIGHEAGID